MYKQNIPIMKEISRSKVLVKNIERVPKFCYCRANEEGIAHLQVYAVSEKGTYMVAEGDSDRTCFLMMKILRKKEDVYIVEYLDHCFNPMDEMYSHLAEVCWYEEFGFCKLVFFHLELLSDTQNRICRMYFDRALYEKMRKKMNPPNKE